MLMESDVTSATTRSPLSSLAHFGFLTLPSFSMIAFTSAVEVLRMANYVGRAQHYRWSVVTPDGVPVRASNGITVKPTRTLEEAGTPDVLIVCGGTQIRSAVDSSVKTLLGDVARKGIPLGGICTGAYALMSAGLLDDYRCAVDWEDLSALYKEFPRVRLADELFVIDRDRLTSTGGTAPLDLMLNLVGSRLGENVVAQISEQFVLERTGQRE
jgi:transcriptional regulator GlxA family with amidase domain